MVSVVSGVSSRKSARSLHPPLMKKQQLTRPKRAFVGACRLSAYSVRTPARASVAKEAYPAAAPALAAVTGLTRRPSRPLPTVR